MTSSNLTKTNRRRTFSLEDSKLHPKRDDGTLKKSLSSTLKISTLAGISNCDLTQRDGDNFDSLDDLNKEIENLCPYNANALLPHQLKVANSRYCDIFSRQSMESDENSSPDDEERIKFLATVPQYGREVLQLVPKKPVVVSSDHNPTYQPCTNTIIQLKQSSFSAFRDMSEMKNPRLPLVEDDKERRRASDDNEDDDDNNTTASVAGSSHAFEKESPRESQQ